MLHSFEFISNSILFDTFAAIFTRVLFNFQAAFMRSPMARSTELSLFLHPLSGCLLSPCLAHNSVILCVGRVCHRPVYVCSLLYRSMIKYILLCSLRQHTKRERDGRERGGRGGGAVSMAGSRYCWKLSATCSILIIQSGSLVLCHRPVRDHCHNFGKRTISSALERGCREGGGKGRCGCRGNDIDYFGIAAKLCRLNCCWLL